MLLKKTPLQSGGISGTIAGHNPSIMALLASEAESFSEQRQPGDIDARSVVAELAAQGKRLSEEQARKLLAKKADEGLLTRHDVYDPVRKRQVAVWREN